MVSEPVESRIMAVIAAHPDDETLGAGGTMARYAEEGWDVHLAVLGRGLGARTSDQDPDQERLETLSKQLKDACNILGVCRLHAFDLPDNRFDKVDLLDVVKVVERVIEEVRPHTVFTHWHGDLNVDHQITARAVVTATRPQPGRPVKEVHAFEVPSATGWRFGAGPEFKPIFYQDITRTLPKKLRALSCYQDELRNPPHVRSLENVERLARSRGAHVGMPAAEAFESARVLRH